MRRQRSFRFPPAEVPTGAISWLIARDERGGSCPFLVYRLMDYAPSTDWAPFYASTLEAARGFVPVTSSLRLDAQHATTVLRDVKRFAGRLEILELWF